MVYFMAIWYILRPFGIFYDHLVYFVVNWCIFPRFGMLSQEKPGNPALHTYACAILGYMPTLLGLGTLKVNGIWPRYIKSNWNLA
jgi:hypothetical protein